MSNETEAGIPAFDHANYLRGARAIGEFLGMTREQVNGVWRHRGIDGAFMLGGKLHLDKREFAKIVEQRKREAAERRNALKAPR